MTPRAQLLLRCTLVAGQAATLIVTWPLWQARSSPPNLPAFAGCPALDTGWLLLATLALVLLAPRWGIAAHALALVLAMAADQLRMQPQCVSLALLLAGTWPGPQGSGLLLARSHLVALYLWAGLHKLLSAGYLPSAARFWERTLPGVDEEGGRILALGVAVFEVALALLIAWPAARHRAGWLAGAMHLGIFLSLSPLGRGRNEAVWPWNLALALTVPLLITSWDRSWRAQVRDSRPAALALALVLVLSPTLYYLGRLDAYLAHCLYSVNVPVAVLARAEQLERLAAAGRSDLRLPDLNSHLQSLRVPFPPAHRLFEQYFRLVGRPGDELHVHDPRAFSARRGQDERVLSWPP